MGWLGGGLGINGQVNKNKYLFIKKFILGN